MKEREIAELIDKVMGDYNRGCEAEDEDDDLVSDRAEDIIRHALLVFMVQNYEEIFGD